MENTIPLLRYVRCPKCLELLTEFSEIPVYKCGGCGAILRAKARSSSGQNLSSVPAVPASQNLDDSDHSTSGSKSPNQKLPDNLNVSESSSDNICKEKSLGPEQNEIKNLNSSEFNGEIQKAKREPWELEGNEELEKSPNVNVESYDVQKPSTKLAESSEPTAHFALSEEDMVNMEFENGGHFRTTSRSSFQPNVGSVSSAGEDWKDRIFHLSRRTFRSKNLSDSTAGENFVRRFSNDRLHSAANAPASSPAEDVEVTSQKSSEEDDQVKILSRFDELRNELAGLFNETSNIKESSLLGVNTSKFQGKIPSKDYRSSLIPFSGDKCCHNEHCRPCPHNVCCHLSEPATLPLHSRRRTINQEPQNLQFKVPRSQNIIRLCRPVSGGAPFVICYNCFKLLQLPVDFLVSPKRVNKLRCGACSQVLMYFFRPRSPSMPETPVEDQHPPSEADRNLASWREDITAWDRISYSESNSSEAEPALDKSRSFGERVEEEQGEGGMFKSLRLHKLMGYSSASELLVHNGYSHR